MVDANDLAELRERVKDRYTAAELVELLGIDTEEIWYAFTDEIVGCVEIVEECGMLDDADDELP